ncbi:MAG: hypothetical protein ABJE95_26505, partial [Byssovorax sp.]
MSRDESERRARAIVASSVAITRAPPVPRAPSDEGEPWDLAALYSVANGFELADRTRILGRAASEKATEWLIEEKSLDWDADLAVIGERDDVVIVHDRDRGGVRAGGGVLEAPTDALSSFRRVALDALSYLEVRAGIEGDPVIAPERAAREAGERGDVAGLAAAIDRGFYPGAARELAHAALRLGALRAATGDEAGALDAFTRSATARVGA